jgi:ATP-dependent DNA helicase RecQ
MLHLTEKAAPEKRRAPTELPPLTEAARQVSAELRKLRLSLAQAGGVPSYVIFNDRTLHELALYLPTDATALGQINGFGEYKVARYGAAVLAVLQRCRDAAAAPGA